MHDEIREYEKLLCGSLEIKKPEMPIFDVLAYTDNEYLLAIADLNDAFDPIDDLYLTLNFLKGD